MSKYDSSSHATFNISYHVVFCTKYRYSLLRYRAVNILKKLIVETASDLGVSVRSMEVMLDHVHLFIAAIPSMTIESIVKRIKGYTSYRMRYMFSYLRKYPSLWTRSYFVESVGHISEKTVLKYIESQTKKPYHPPVKTGRNPGLIS